MTSHEHPLGLPDRMQPTSPCCGAGIFESYVLSTVGEECDLNEDFAIVDSGSGVFIVADGLGGRPRGDLASRAAAEAFLHQITLVPPPHRLEDKQLRKAVDVANDEVRRLAGSNPMLTGMGTTLSVAVLADSHAKIVHVGDSRIYHYRRPELRVLTRDHTVAADLLHQNHLSPKAAATSPMRHVLTRCVGPTDHVGADIADIELQPRDLLLLATDGLSKSLDDTFVKEIMESNEGRSPQKLCEEIMNKASKTPLRDNVTIVIVQFNG